MLPSGLHGNYNPCMRSLLIAVVVITCLVDGLSAQVADQAVSGIKFRPFTYKDEFEGTPPEGVMLDGNIKSKKGFLFMGPKSTFIYPKHLSSRSVTLESRFRFPKLSQEVPRSLTALSFITSWDELGQERLSIVFRRVRTAGGSIEGYITLEHTKVDNKRNRKSTIYAKVDHNETDLTGEKLQMWRLDFDFGRLTLSCDGQFVAKAFHEFISPVVQGFRIDNNYGIFPLSSLEWSGEAPSKYKERHNELSRKSNQLFLASQQLQSSKDHQRAFRLAQERIKIAKELWGGDALFTCLCSSDALIALAKGGEYQTCVDRWPPVIARMEELLGAEHPSVLFRRSDYAAALDRTDRQQEALVILDDVIKQLERGYSESLVDTVKLGGLRKLRVAVEGRNLRTVRGSEDIEQIVDTLEKQLALQRSTGDDDSWGMTEKRELLEYYRRFSSADPESKLFEFEQLRKTIDSQVAKRDFDGIVGRVTQAAELAKELLGKDDPMTLKMLRLVGRHQFEHGNAVQKEGAINVLESLREAYASRYGVEHPKYHDLLNGLAIQMSATRGDRKTAIKLLAESARFYEKYKDQPLPDGNSTFLRARALSNIAVEYFAMGEMAQAERFYLAALPMFGEPDTPYTISIVESTLRGLARTQQQRFPFTRQLSEELLAAGIREMSPQQEARLVAFTGTLAATMGDSPRARFVLRSLVHPVVDRPFSDGHPLWIVASHRSAQLDAERGKEALARTKLEEVLHKQLASIADLSAGLSTVDAFLLAGYVQSALDDYLSLGYEQSYVHALPFKALRFGIRSSGRHGMQSDETTKILDEIERLTAKFSAQYARGWDSYPYDLEEMLKQQQNLESLLIKEERANVATSGDEVLKKLRRNTAEDAALVDYYAYRKSHEPDSALQLCAFVVRGEKPVQRVELGSYSHIGLVAEKWLSSIYKNSGEAEIREHGLKLRQLIWEPVEPHFQLASSVAVVPDFGIDLLPFEALPADIDGTYLLDNYNISMMPSAAWAVRCWSKRSPKPAPLSMLLVGDIDYNRSVSDPTDRPKLQAFELLPDGKDFIPRVRSKFQKVGDADKFVVLSKADAAEGKVRAAIGGKTIVHLDTHGAVFQQTVEEPHFPTKSMKPIFLRDQHFAVQLPGMQSSIALAGANRAGSRTGGHDGLLWAAEAATLDLTSAELVVLDSCSSGRDAESFRSEGMFSLQRAVHAAGARTAVSTLWPVFERATIVLWDEFYQNLWERGMNKAESLREAKRTIRDRFDHTAGKLRVPGEQGEPCPAFFWAPFVLSGDWE
jgi:CHAT domain-containing protein